MLKPIIRNRVVIVDPDNTHRLDVIEFYSDKDVAEKMSEYGIITSYDNNKYLLRYDMRYDRQELVAYIIASGKE